MGYLSPARPRVLAHRGLAVDVPENTLAAFEAAVRAGAAYVETDVHLSSDGVAMIAHDPTLERVAGRAGRVGASTAAELSGIDLGGGVGFPTLADALSAFPDTRFNIDVKEEAAVESTVDAVRGAGAVDRVLLTSFDDARRRRLAALLPGVATSVGSAGVVRAILTGRFGAAAMRRAVRGAVALQIPERAGRVRIVTPAFVRALHSAGLEVHVWTVNEPDDMRRLLALGVDGLVTDRCDLALEVIANLKDA